MTKHDLQDPSDTPITEVVVLRDGVEIGRYPCESEQEAADIIAHWDELPGVECEVVDVSTGRDEEATDITWLDPAGDYPLFESDPAS